MYYSTTTIMDSIIILLYRQSRLYLAKLEFSSLDKGYHRPLLSKESRRVFSFRLTRSGNSSSSNVGRNGYCSSSGSGSGSCIVNSSSGNCSIVVE